MELPQYNRQINTGTSTYPFLQTPSLAPAAPLRSTPGTARRRSGPGSAPELIRSHGRNPYDTAYPSRGAALRIIICPVGSLKRGTKPRIILTSLTGKLSLIELLLYLLLIMFLIYCSRRKFTILVFQNTMPACQNSHIGLPALRRAPQGNRRHVEFGEYIP